MPGVNNHFFAKLFLTSRIVKTFSLRSRIAQHSYSYFRADDDDVACSRQLSRVFFTRQLELSTFALRPANCSGLLTSTSQDFRTKICFDVRFKVVVNS